MAWGNQNWKGNCADLLKAPNNMSANTKGYAAWERNTSPLASTWPTSKLPTILPINNRPANKAKPPAPVNVRAMRAPLRASDLRHQKPTNKKELMLVSHQKNQSCSKV